jgi:predicted RNase H-like HicB family nuclease
MEFILTEYINAAMALAEYDKLEDGSFAGRIPKGKGVLAFSKTLKGCENELRSTLEDWIIVGLKLGHRLPVISSINLNRRPRRESLVTCKRKEEVSLSRAIDQGLHSKPVSRAVVYKILEGKW